MHMTKEYYFAPLLAYCTEHNLTVPEDHCYFENTLLSLFHANAPEELPEIPLPEHPSLSQLLEAYTELAAVRGVIPDRSVTQRDLFAAKLMGLFTPLPSHTTLEFSIRGMQSAKSATDWFYHLCLANGYIQKDRINKNIRWQTENEFGKLDLTINLSKPEKDPKEIAAAAAVNAPKYPQCLLCRENEGYAGRLDHPARQNLRVIPIRLQGEPWFFQYSPYAYYNEHCIVLDARHIPMKIDKECFAQLLDFVSQFPHYFVGSNADLPVVGGSILSHAHFQGGNDRFPMAEAPTIKEISFEGWDDIKCGIVKWPMSVLRLRGTDKERIADLAEIVLNAWKDYSDPDFQIIAHTGDTPHHTITPIARFRDDAYELDLVLRDNHTTPEHPLGLFHPHSELHHIKKENIGLIEVMGRAILPARLKRELELTAEWIRNGMPETMPAEIEKHTEWVRSWVGHYRNDADWQLVLWEEVGKVFLEVLKHCGVYPCTDAGIAGFSKFLSTIG